MTYEEALALIGTKAADLPVEPIVIREAPRQIVNFAPGTDAGNFYEGAILRRAEAILFE